ncbi:Clp protease ClpP [Bradyrhizobium sp. BRP22]|uniref:head maturation protease, ClpP-related n=1 Tax=Bradyrhizobium sp. BRP22 TaxID=2793821 RepID=UPI001CD3DD1F|nr:head maturation protease, ClpP-related [Bradyrhizobium sp. BRP22]MCA1452847.1 Clp protease ClpP [Bradyrhizobium sp. BRP22]
MRQWFTMKAEDTNAEIVIYDEIGKSFWGEETVAAKQFLDDLAALGDIDSITLRINSPGGDVFDGVAIHNAIKNHKAKVTAHVDGIAASIASYIAMAADKIVMPSNAFMLIHNASGFVMGDADDMRTIAADLDRIDKSIAATYVARTGSSAAKVKALMKEDRLMDAAEAKELGFADEVTKPVKMAANFSLRLMPKAAAERFRAETGDVQGDPPPPATEPEKPVVPPAAPPASPVEEEPATAPAVTEPAPAAKVVDLNAAKQQGIDEHKAYVASVTDLCVLAGMPERVGYFVRAAKPVDDVRKDLLTLRAARTDVLPHHPLIDKTVAPATLWGKITDKLNARVK